MISQTFWRSTISNSWVISCDLISFDVQRTLEDFDGLHLLFFWLSLFFRLSLLQRADTLVGQSLYTFLSRMILRKSSRNMLSFLSYTRLLQQHSGQRVDNTNDSSFGGQQFQSFSFLFLFHLFSILRSISTSKLSYLYSYISIHPCLWLIDRWSIQKNRIEK